MNTKSNKAKLLISSIENICNFSTSYMSEHEEAKEHYERFKLAMMEGDDYGLKDMGVSYYNFKYLVDIYGQHSTHMHLKWNDSKGSEDLCQYLIDLTGDTIIDLIYTKKAWGSKEILSLPHGVEMQKEMKAMGKSSLGTKDIIHLLFSIKAKVLGFTYYDEFVNMMKEQKTMVNKKVAQGFLRDFWNNTKEDYKGNPLLFKTIKNTIIRVNDTIETNNVSTQQLRLRFMESFITLTTNKPKNDSDEKQFSS